MLCHLLAMVGAVLFLAQAGVLEGVVKGDMDGSL